MKPGLRIRFYQELNDLVDPDRRFRESDVPWTGRRSAKDLIESLGVPHTEVDLILINGESAGFDVCPEPGDRLSVYPVFESLDIGSLGRLRSRPLRDPRFVGDVHLGKLARRLRLLGFDVLWNPDWDDPQLARLTREQERILLTRDRGLLKRRLVDRGILIRSDAPDRQLAEVVRRLDLTSLFRPFTRCAVCNGHNRPVPPGTPAWDEALAEAPPRVREHCRAYRRCDSCGRLYWEGTHTVTVRRWMSQLEKDREDSQAASFSDGSGGA